MPSPGHGGDEWCRRGDDFGRRQVERVGWRHPRLDADRLWLLAVGHPTGTVRLDGEFQPHLAIAWPPDSGRRRKLDEAEIPRPWDGINEIATRQTAFSVVGVEPGAAPGRI